MQIYDKIKISSIIFLLFIVGVLVVTSISLDDREQNNINFIELDGNIHLPTDEYYRYAKLLDESDYENLTPALVKDRLEKHPYIRQVDAIVNENTLTLTIKEKNFESLLMLASGEWLVTENNIKIPKLPFSEMIDYPIITNPLEADSLSEFQSVISNEDITTGLKIISTLKLISPDLYDNLSEIDMRNGRDIVIQFSKFNFPIVIGRDNEIDKVMYLEQLIQSLDGEFLADGLEYIDLRYSQQIYLGRSIDNNDERGTNS